MPPLKLVWYDGGLRPPRPEGLEDEQVMDANGRLLIGDKGIILVSRLYPEGRRQEFTAPPKTIPRSPGHYKEWVEACKSGKTCGSDFAFAGPLAEAVQLGNVALRVQLRRALTRYALLWDSPNLRFTNRRGSFHGPRSRPVSGGRHLHRPR